MHATGSVQLITDGTATERIAAGFKDISALDTMPSLSRLITIAAETLVSM